MKQISEFTGEEIAEAISQSYALIMQAQSNLDRLHTELEKRKGSEEAAEPAEQLSETDR